MHASLSVHLHSSFFKHAMLSVLLIRPGRINKWKIYDNLWKLTVSELFSLVLSGPMSCLQIKNFLKCMWLVKAEDLLNKGCSDGSSLENLNYRVFFHITWICYSIFWFTELLCWVLIWTAVCQLMTPVLSFFFFKKARSYFLNCAQVFARYNCALFRL